MPLLIRIKNWKNEYLKRCLYLYYIAYEIKLIGKMSNHTCKHALTKCIYGCARDKQKYSFLKEEREEKTTTHMMKSKKRERATVSKNPNDCWIIWKLNLNKTTITIFSYYILPTYSIFWTNEILKVNLLTHMKSLFSNKSIDLFQINNNIHREIHIFLQVKKESNDFSPNLTYI